MGHEWAANNKKALCGQAGPQQSMDALNDSLDTSFQFDFDPHQLKMVKICSVMDLSTYVTGRIGQSR